MARVPAAAVTKCLRFTPAKIAPAGDGVNACTPDAGITGYIEIVAKRIVLLTLAFLVAIAIVFVFGYRAGRHAHLMRWANSPVRPWMSVPFVAHTHHVPVETLFAAIGVTPHAHDRRPLRRIAQEEKRPVEDLVRAIDQAIAKARGAPAAATQPQNPSGKSP